jgi:hypothetical protein
LVVFFTFSFAALLYQVIWQRMLSIVSRRVGTLEADKGVLVSSDGRPRRLSGTGEARRRDDLRPRMDVQGHAGWVIREGARREDYEVAHHAADGELGDGVSRLARRDLHAVDYVYVWVDGVHFRVRLEEDRLCTLVMIGVRPDGTKELPRHATAVGRRHALAQSKGPSAVVKKHLDVLKPMWLDVNNTGASYVEKLLAFAEKYRDAYSELRTSGELGAVRSLNNRIGLNDSAASRIRDIAAAVVQLRPLIHVLPTSMEAIHSIARLATRQPSVLHSKLKQGAVTPWLSVREARTLVETVRAVAPTARHA